MTGATSDVILKVLTGTGILLFLFGVSTVLFRKKKQRLKKLWIAIGTTGIISAILKFIVEKPRPVEPQYFFGSIPDYAFPSLHTAFAFAVLPFVWKEAPKYKYVFLALAVIVGINRIYFQEHDFIDVLAGAVLGLAIGWGIQRKWKK